MIVRDSTYLKTVQRMQRALYEFHIRGIKTNILFLENVLRHPEFLSGLATTSFIDRCALALPQHPETYHKHGLKTCPHGVRLREGWPAAKPAHITACPLSATLVCFMSSHGVAHLAACIVREAAFSVVPLG